MLTRIALECRSRAVPASFVPCTPEAQGSPLRGPTTVHGAHHCTHAVGVEHQPQAGVPCVGPSAHRGSTGGTGVAGRFDALEVTLGTAEGQTQAEAEVARQMEEEGEEGEGEVGPEARRSRGQVCLLGRPHH